MSQPRESRNMTIDLTATSAFTVGDRVFRPTPEDINLIVGKSLTESVSKGDPMLWSFVDIPQRYRSGLAPTIPHGMRAISIAVSGEHAVSALAARSRRPNGRVL